MSYFKFYRRVLEEECPRKGWFKVVKTARVLLAEVGISAVALWLLLNYLFPDHLWLARGITALLIAIGFLLVLTRQAQTYHERVLGEARAEWIRRTEIAHKLHEDLAEGNRLADFSKNPGHPNLKALIDNWNRVVAYRLSNISEAHTRTYYKGSRSGEFPPDAPDDWEGWIRERVERLKGFIDEFESPPPQLASHSPSTPAGITAVSRSDRW